MSPVESAIFAAVERAASLGLPCPTNAELAGAAGIESVGASSGILSRLAARGLVTVERGQTSRVVTITATGKRTAGVVGSKHWRDREGVQVKPRKVPERNTRAFCARVEEVLPPVVDRTPCSFCGVRADVGCHHTRAVA